MGVNNVKIEWLEFSYWTAGANWMMWRADFEFEGPILDMPVLNNATRFQKFVSEYRLRLMRPHDVVLQTIRNLNCDLAIADPSGAGIDALANALRLELINNNLPNPGLQRSLISKLATFARPDQFIAWDQFARQGAAWLTNGPANGQYGSYADYIGAVNIILAGEIGQEICTFLEIRPLPANCDISTFKRRVLDVYLMVAGGRWQEQLAGHPQQ